MTTRGMPRQPGLTPLATDGQGVVLALPQSSDPRQRVGADLLARRLAHRLGRPVELCVIDRGHLDLSVALNRLGERGAQEIVVVPLGTQAPQVLSTPGFDVAVSRPAGNDPALVQAAREVLAAGDLRPDAATEVVLVRNDPVPGTTTGAGAVEVFVTDGWRGAVVVSLSPAGSDPCQAVVAAATAGPRAVVVPLALTAGAFTDRVRACADAAGATFVGQTLHGTEAVARLLSDRVAAARLR